MAIAFDIGGTKIAAARVGADLAASEIGRVPTPIRDYDAFCAAIADLAGQGDEPIGISIAGVVDPRDGRLIVANIPCADGKPLAADLEDRLNRRVSVLNDAKAFALAEANVGLGKGHASVLAVIIGTGVGGAFVLNGRLVMGSTGSAGEWGHGPAAATRTGATLPIVRCGCGRPGCVDTLGGARGLERLHRHLTSIEADSPAILAAWQQGEPDAVRTLDVYLDVVGGALANTVNILDPDIVPIGGGLARNAALIAAIDAEVRSRTLGQRAQALCVPTETGPEKGLVGAAIHVSEAPAP
ncbi:N-acetyl-D-glucosamine kinase [Pleomorphomonas sp. T1.2MG-36]|uniref:ROK family protein n=1 Tax=Pleomorphomonas sp. T1.2MG-36 TaxID=3041167 RepID=UPI002477BF7B|nr:ROK family protein [Pleomorphomonas sp. T1.2MG-36]CAI9401021.1 N-acetyl-D-glucosamine kinase [Pleomorphomonas sp. T1.2MG-36]